MRLRLLLTTALILYASVGFAFDDSTIEAMPFVLSSDYCQECHTAKDTRAFQLNTTQSCSVYCTTCHDDLGSHHEVNVFIGEKSPPVIALLNDKIACFTCHDLKQKRVDQESWKAESLYESMFNKKEVYPTYYLIIKNNEGQLCKQCH